MSSKTKIFTCGIVVLFLLLTSVLIANLSANGEMRETSGILELSNKIRIWK